MQVWSPSCQRIFSIWRTSPRTVSCQRVSAFLCPPSPSAMSTFKGGNFWTYSTDLDQDFKCLFVHRYIHFHRYILLRYCAPWLWPTVPPPKPFPPPPPKCADVNKLKKLMEEALISKILILKDNWEQDWNKFLVRIGNQDKINNFNQCKVWGSPAPQNNFWNISSFFCIILGVDLTLSDPGFQILLPCIIQKCISTFLGDGVMGAETNFLTPLRGEGKQKVGCIQ